MKKKLENIRVTDMAATGKALAKVDGQVVFIDKAVPGDLVDIRILRKKKKHLEGKAEVWHEYSEHRTKAKCQYFGTCGGCKWQNIKYKEQLHFKETQVRDNLERIGKLDLPDIEPIMASERTFHYRNKLEFTFSNRKWLTREEIDSGQEIDRNGLGFHMPGHFDKVVDIDSCQLQGELCDSVRNEIREYAREKNLAFYDILERHGLLRTLVFRESSTGESMIILQVAEDQKEQVHPLLDHVISKFPQLTSVNYVVNRKANDDFSDQAITHYAGSPWITEEMEHPGGEGKIQFRISPKSFYQTNSHQAENLYRLAWEKAGLSGGEVVYDLYTGTGTIACYIASGATKVVGIEYVEDAVKDARVNAEINGYDHLEFYAGDMKDILNSEFVNNTGTPDLVITDPPRAGMHKDVCTQLLELNSRKIIYISCNPATQARDLELLSERYKVTFVQPVDMFPHTPHVENVVVLERTSE